MPSKVVLDACVLYPLPLRDTLLRVAQQGLYSVCWSERILDEVARNLIEHRRATPQQARALISAMQRAFDDACVPEPALAALEPTMTNAHKDRHVLAAAVASGAQAIVTSNLRHFPKAACQVAALSRPPINVWALLDLLEESVPQFAKRIRDDLPSD